jgi:hypothetical protein
MDNNTRNMISGLFLGVIICATSIHLNVYLGNAPNYFICTTQYFYVGILGWALFYLYNYLIKRFKKNA